MRTAFVDIGELGWSLHLSAHARWLKQRGQPMPLVVTLPDRICLYEGLADSVGAVPSDFNREFGQTIASCFGLEGVPADRLRGYFNSMLAPDYVVTDEMTFRCKPFWPHTHRDKFLFVPYAYKMKLSGPKEILIFPRWRNSVARNIPKSFYIMLIDALCDKFCDCVVRTIGVPNGAYDIYEVKKGNYVNRVGENGGLQCFIDRCQLAVAAVGSQSAPPKISLLQGVPTFIIGHERDRHVNRDNWMSTKVGFYEIPHASYDSFNFSDCTARIMEFVRGCG